MMAGLTRRDGPATVHKREDRLYVVRNGVGGTIVKFRNAAAIQIENHPSEASMTIQDKILEKYRSASIGEAGTEIYVEGEAALGIPADCENANVAIIGVDTFTITQGSTYPHLDGIMDFSPRIQRAWDDFRQRCNKAALEFMQEMRTEKGRHTYFSFVIIDIDAYEETQSQLR